MAGGIDVRRINCDGGLANDERLGRVFDGACCEGN